nr:MAG: hypothetical protein [Culex narnavirus 1]
MPNRASGRWRKPRLLLSLPRGYGDKCLPLDGQDRIGADGSATPGCTLTPSGGSHCSRARPQLGATLRTAGVRSGVLLCPPGERRDRLPASVVTCRRTVAIHLSDPDCELGEGGISRRASPTPASRPADWGPRGGDWSLGTGGRGRFSCRPARARLHPESAKGELAAFVEDKADASRRARFSYHRQGQVDSLTACRSLYGRRCHRSRLSSTLPGLVRLNHASPVSNRGGQSRVTSGRYRRANACGYRIPTVSCTVRGWWFMTAASSFPT